MVSNKLLRSAVVLLLIGAPLVGCRGTAAPVARGSTPTPTDTSPTATEPFPYPDVDPTRTPSAALASYAFPATIDPDRRYMFYLHGKIVEDQGLPAISPEYGEYQYEEILEVLQGYGFVVISEQRPRDSDGGLYALRVAAQVDDLLGSGVPPGSITVVGASKGAAITMAVSDLVANPDVNYVLLGGCEPGTVTELLRQGVTLSGNVLAIADSVDEYAGTCEGVFDLSAGRLGRHEEIMLHVGTGHGILYQPLSEWVEPTVEWANQEW